MNALKTLIGAVALIAACVSSKADFVMTANGTAEIQKTFIVGSNSAATATLSFNNKFIYALVSNAVANVTNWAGTAIAPTNLPADGYIAYNPTANAPILAGVFYVTNKSGIFYPLSGVDTNGQYYSWIELDSQNIFYKNAFPMPLLDVRFSLGWGGDFSFQGITSYRLDSKTNGTQTATSTAVFYAHDDPYSYDDAENPYIVFSNDNAVDVRGILTVTIAVTSTNKTMTHLSMTGSGNLIYDPNDTYMVAGGMLVKNATIKFGK